MTPSEHNKTREIELTEVEWTLMKVVWENEPCAAGTVQEALAQTKGWAYSTVKTTLDRMVDKGLLGVQRIRNLQLFSAEVTQVEARRSELYRMLRRAFDGALTPMMQFLVEHQGLSPEEAQALRTLANKTETSKGD